jgi:hypothetical protein
MISNPELQRLLATQPLSRLQTFASALGWQGLTLWHHIVPDEDMIRLKLQTQVILWYETPDPKFGLQINIHPHGQMRHYQAIVKAERYGISVTDWHEFDLPDEPERIAAIAEPLKPFLLRINFKDPAWRKAFFQQRPERATIMRRSKNRRGKPNS